MPLDPEVLTARIKLRIVRLELEAMRLAAEIAREQERTSMQTRTKRAIWIAQEMLRRSRQQRPRD
jgi:hypothetical protein